MFKWIIGAMIVTGVGLLGTMFTYVGAFKKVNVYQGKAGPFIFIFKPHLGPYHDIVKLMDEVAQELKLKGIECPRTFGRFLDSPDTVAQDRLRSDVGCVVTKPIDMSLFPTLKTQSLDPSYYVIGEFDGAPSIGPMKVYPKLDEFIREHRLSKSGPPIEIYELVVRGGVKTQYLFSIKAP